MQGNGPLVRQRVGPCEESSVRSEASGALRNPLLGRRHQSATPPKGVDTAYRPRFSSTLRSQSQGVAMAAAPGGLTRAQGAGDSGTGLLPLSSRSTIESKAANSEP